MLSTELPITDWWDPEWEVYDVPISPDNVPHDVWWPAYFHQAMIEYITTGRTWGWPDGILTRQLEPPRRPPSWYPGQPEPPRPRRRPCTCFYGLRYDVPGTTRGPRAFNQGGFYVRCFVIVFDCPHHGDDRLEEELALDEAYPDGGVWGFTLDDC